jgi:hypothetical protein
MTKSALFQKLKSLPLYTFFFAAYPVLALLASNAGQVKIGVVWRPLLICVVIAGLLLGVLKLFLGDWQGAAFLSTLLLALFFSYGHVYLLLTKKLEDYNFTPWLLLSWFILALLATFWANIKPPPSVLTLNLIALGLVCTSLAQIGPRLHKKSVHSVGAQNAPILELVHPQNPPDVYYFILDSYGREDLLKQAYGFDNSPFITALRDRGFYVAECSQSNFVRTEISVTSSLNMSYLQYLDPAFVPGTSSRRVLWTSFKYSAARYNFENLGYKIVAFATGFDWSEFDDADVFYAPPPFAAGMTEFETLFIQTTLARHAQDLGWIDPDENFAQNFRNRTLLVFDKMDELAHIPQPTFAFIHVISPHPPFVFGPNGEHTYPADFWNEEREYPPDLYAKGYQNQLTFLNQKVLQAVDTLITESDTPPIIILQGDHGPWLQPTEKRFRILNAYYLPGSQDRLYPSISPVNTFRLIFNAYFGGKYDMLADRSYFSPPDEDLYDFSIVPSTCPD